MLPALLLLAAWLPTARAQYPGWQHSGSLHLLTTPAGADLPAEAREKDFPLLVRLHRDFFNFSEAGAHGEDIRFSSGGQPLAFQVEEWDPAEGTASFWVRIPVIQGNARQEISMHWGKAGATSESNGGAVFNEANGYASVWHMNAPVQDAVGTIPARDDGTTATVGVIGPARHLAGGQGIFGGEKITSLPAGGSSHTSEVWFRPEKPNGRVLGWGNEQGQGKVVMNFRSPPHAEMDCYFSAGNVAGSSAVPLGEWTHVAHTFHQGEARIYVNGVLDGTSKNRGAPLNIRSPARLWIGGWYHHYDFVGDIDEARISRVARSAAWIKLEYENQKPLQTLVGLVVPPGNALSVSTPKLSLLEGRSAEISAQAGGALKTFWILQRNCRETVAAVDRLRFKLDAGRVTGDQSFHLQFRAVYPDGIKTLDIPVTIKEDIQEPVFTLPAPAQWDGRRSLVVVPVVANLAEMQAKGAGVLHYHWNQAGPAVIKEIAPGKLLLERAQNSGTLAITLAVDNGGAATIQSAAIKVTEPATDPWVPQPPGREETPQDNQFFARDDRNEGWLHYRGTLAAAADKVFLRVYAGDQLVHDESLPPAADRSYALAARLQPGLIKYRAEMGTQSGHRETVLHTATNLVCGDAYIINGQSNAEATDVGPTDPPYTSDWIRSFGSPAGHPEGARLDYWGNAVCRSRQGGQAQVGYWGLELARRLLENQQIPICILNGAVGGTRIDQHQRNPANPEDVSTIYGRLLWRVRRAGLTHGIRAVLWHQGENDQGADGPTGGFGWETYRDYFIDLAAAWKQDYPNIQHYYVFQIWPKACSMGVNGSDNQLREVQRTLPACFSHLDVMSTLGIKPPGGCHYPPAGYAEIARLICPLLERDLYHKVFPGPITAANLRQARFTSLQKDELALEFDQPMAWHDSLVSQFYLDGGQAKVLSGSARDNVITLKLAGAGSAGKITYLDSQRWDVNNLLYGANGLAALTFCKVPITPVAVAGEVGGLRFSLPEPAVDAGGGTLESQVQATPPGDLGPLATEAPEGKALVRTWTLAFAEPCRSNVTVTAAVEIDQDSVVAAILPGLDGVVRQVALDHPTAWPARYVLGQGAAGPQAGTELALPAIGLLTKKGATIGLALDPFCGVAFRWRHAEPGRLRIEASTTYLGARVPLREERRTLALAAHPNRLDAPFAAFYATVPELKPAPAWVHGVRLVYYDYLSQDGQGWFRDIDELARRLPDRADRAKVALCLHGWYDYLGRYAFDEATGALARQWIPFPQTRNKPMTPEDLRQRLRYARERGFHPLLYFADGVLADDKAPGFDPRRVYVDGGGRTQFPCWKGPDTLGDNRYQDPAHPAVRAHYLDYLRALLREVGEETDGFVLDESFYIRREWISATRPDQPAYADRAMMTLVAQLAQLAQTQSAGRLVFLTSDIQGDPTYGLPGNTPPSALVAHGTYQDSGADPGRWAGGLFPNYRNSLWSCAWEPITRQRAYNRTNAVEWGLPQGLSNGWGDNTGPADMAARHPELLAEMIRRFHECQAPRKRYVAQVAISTQYGTTREDFLVGTQKNRGFILLPRREPAAGPRPWVWYAPTFVQPGGGLPDPSHTWMFDQWLTNGFAIGGVDVGESYGNPAGRAVFTEYHRTVVQRYGLSPKACLLPQSRGGLMLYNWAAEHPDLVQCVGGIYTVCDQSSWPGLSHSSPAYGLGAAELAQCLDQHNPIGRLGPLAKARVPILHLHGDSDTVVPLERNSGELARRYQALGGDMQLIIIPGKGHEVCPEFFHNRALVDFFLKQTRP